MRREKAASTPTNVKVKKAFHMEFKNTAQKLAWSSFEQHDVLFLLGPAGVGKTFLAMAFAISELLSKKKKKIILTRPIVDAGEHLGYLPGTFQDKINPYLMPLYDSMDALVGIDTQERDKVNSAIEIAPLAYLRGRTFVNSVCILDEAQNCTKAQIILFLTRLGEDSKIIITGDPTQSDLHGTPYINEATKLLSSVPGISIMEFNEGQIVRHPLVGRILEKLK
jgi:phosphate starvation-inducible PhoH-like protein